MDPKIKLNPISLKQRFHFRNNNTLHQALMIPSQLQHLKIVDLLVDRRLVLLLAFFLLLSLLFSSSTSFSAGNHLKINHHLISKMIPAPVLMC
ncbi:hypothetical protein TVAGG3_0297870, partial [Trichomonas vaginalis G3]|uniref:hypothetical protein n=1 Tax=Trichomonas vaginalis (strain ATCC PRA-98 / G3) TaxID=412133 RepID=UPI0021E56B34